MADSWTEYTDADNDRRFEQAARKAYASKRLRSEAYELASPELRARMDEEDRLENYAQNAERQARVDAADRERRSNSVKRSTLTFVAIILGLSMMAAIVYGAVKFVKWAWFN